jgi:hypothetical protein
VFPGRTLRDGLQLVRLPTTIVDDMKTASGGLFVLFAKVLFAKVLFAKALCANPFCPKALLKYGLCLKKSLVSGGNDPITPLA